MPLRLNGDTAAKNLRTIVESSKNHGRGTMYVGEENVSHRTRLGRFFKSAPTSNTESINNFKRILEQAYPNARDQIQQLLSSSYAKGRLTPGAVQRAYRQIHEDHKFKIEYPVDAKSKQDRLLFEDHRALAVLQDPKSIASVSNTAIKLANHIENSAHFTDAHAENFLNGHLGRQSNYPVHPGAFDIPKTKAGLVEFLRSTANGSAPDKQVLLLSVMWMLPKTVGAAENLEATSLVDRLYRVKVGAGKQHTDLRQLFLRSMSDLKNVADEFALGIEKSVHFTDQDADDLSVKHFNKQAKYLSQPNPNERPKTKAELIAFLRTPAQASDRDRSILLSAILKDELQSSDPKSEKISQLHRALTRSKNPDSTFNMVIDAVTKPGTFGNTEIDSNLMDNFLPHQKEREAVQVHKKPNERVQKFLAQGNPYISGSSGMANCGSSIYPLLGIDMRSEDGKQYGEALAAFIVGAGEHSYPEAYKSLNLSLRYLQLGQELAIQQQK